jgi:hypothetical protein
MSTKGNATFYPNDISSLELIIFELRLKMFVNDMRKADSLNVSIFMVSSLFCLL